MNCCRHVVWHVSGTLFLDTNGEKKRCVKDAGLYIAMRQIGRLHWNWKTVVEGRVGRLSAWNALSSEKHL